jgi:hypothetical protein
MDMQSGFQPRHSGESFATPGIDYVHLAERRKRVFALIREFQRAVARPRGLNDAVRILGAILPCTGAYFAIVESLLDKLTGDGAAPHRDEHRRILGEISETLDRVSGCDAKPVAAQLAHALDALVMYEAAIRFRDSRDPNPSSDDTSIPTALPA